MMRTEPTFVTRGDIVTWTGADSGLAWTLTAKAYTSQGQQTDIRLATFNCYGYKSSSAYCDNLFSTNEVTFVCEAWLTVAECQQVKKSLENTHWSSLKSSMDPKNLHMRHPYGVWVLFAAKIKTSATLKST